MLEYTIRDATKDDAESIIEIELESFPNPWRIENYLHEFEVPFAHIFVAEYRDNIIGFADLWIIKDEIHLNKIAVRPRYRTFGIGGGIIAYIIRKFDSMEMKKILLEVRERNSEARRFYKGLGFKENGRRNKYYPDDNAILIEKDL